MYADSMFLSFILAERMIPVSPIPPIVAQNLSEFSSLEQLRITPFLVHYFKTENTFYKTTFCMVIFPVNIRKQ